MALRTASRATGWCASAPTMCAQLQPLRGDDQVDSRAPVQLPAHLRQERDVVSRLPHRGQRGPEIPGSLCLLEHEKGLHLEAPHLR
jgi:hypothetical protein